MLVGSFAMSVSDYPTIHDFSSPIAIQSPAWTKKSRKPSPESGAKASRIMNELFHLLEQNKSLHRIYLGMQCEAQWLRIKLDRVFELENLNESCSMIMLENIQSTYMFLVREHKDQCIHSIHNFYDTHKDCYSLEKFYRCLESLSNRWVKKSQNKEIKNKIVQSLEILKSCLMDDANPCYEIYKRIDDRRNDYLAHRSAKKVYQIGFQICPYLDGVDDHIKSYAKSISKEEIHGIAKFIFKFFETADPIFLNQNNTFANLVQSDFILHAANNKTSLNVWNFNVIMDSSFSLCTV